MIQNRKIIPSESAEDILRDILIVQLATAGMPQVKIREVVGADMHRVSYIVKNLNLENRHGKKTRTF